MRIREFKDKNYKAIYINGKTLRIAFDPSKEIKELDFPEFYDLKITNACTGNCPYCYQDSKHTGKHFENIVEKCQDFFGNMSENEKPFQVALGGGNPNQHPDFIKLLEYFVSIGITPNYTTNGIGLTEDIINATKKYCGGVAVSCHPHLKEIWQQAVEKLTNRNILTDLHIIISDKSSVDNLRKIYSEYKDKVEYFVLLPHMAQGRATNKEIDYEELTSFMQETKSKKIAFGANFYEYLKKNKDSIKTSLYEPEIMSKYLDLSNMNIYKSSFAVN